MRIWVDADACPTAIKEILFRTAVREQLLVTLVANQPITTPNSEYIKTLQVTQGFDVADNAIVERTESGDLVITSDIPLADQVITKGALALNPRGALYTKQNIKAKLNMRDFMDSLRSSGIQTGGPTAFGLSDRQNFANSLDRLIAKTRKRRNN